VIQVLCERERAKAFNQSASDQFPTIRGNFDDAITDFVIVREGKTSARKLRKIAANAWKWDHAEDRRIRNAKKGGRFLHMGRPEVYDPRVVWAFADVSASAADRPRFSTGHHGDVAISSDSKAGSPMLHVLVAAVQWAMIRGWQCAGPPGTEPPTVKPEGILTLIKRGR
jgi:hypothetical protein